MPPRLSNADMPARVTAVNSRRPGGWHRLAAIGLATMAVGAIVVLIAGGDRRLASVIGVAVVSALALGISIPLWITAGRRHRHAGQLLSIWQGKLFLTAPDSPARAIRLAEAVATVQLVGGVRGSGEGTSAADDESTASDRPVPGSMSIRPSEYFVPLHPVLRLEQPDEGTTVTVELCQVASRRMRDRGQLLALARAVENTAGDGAAHAAGQLRTLAKWQRLPQIIDAEPDAVVATPVDRPDHAPVLPTPVRAGVLAAEIEIPGSGRHQSS